MPSKKLIFFLLFFSLYNISIQLLLFSEESKLYYNQPKTYELNLKDFLKKNGDTIIGSPIIISVYNKNETFTKINLLAKLNSMPSLGTFDHSDSFGNNGLYTISFSPCEFEYNKDIIYINIILEKDVDTSYKIDINNLDNNIYETICTNLPKKDSTIKTLIFPGLTQTFKGVAQFGGKNGDKEVLNDLFILKDNNTWIRYDNNLAKEKPNPRYGMGIISFDSGDYFIVYGGKNDKNGYENDLWVFDVDKEKWFLIGKSEEISNFPVNTFLPSLISIENRGIILAFGNNDPKNNNIYAFDIYILRRLLQKYNDADGKVKNNLLSNLIKVYPNKGNIELRYGLSIDQVDENKIMFFGGYDSKTNKVTNKCELLNLDKLPKLDITNCTNKNQPPARAFHSTIKYGPDILLFGGQKSPNEFYNDIYKYLSLSKTWIKLDAEEESNLLKIYGSKLFYNYLEGSPSDKPIIINSDNNYILRLNFIRCNNNKEEMSSSKFCLPCSLGYILEKSKCVPCIEGQYFQFNRNNYFASKCETCQPGTYSNRRGGTGLNGCRLCPYDTFNSQTGQIFCEICPEEKTCLIGSTSPMEYLDIQEEDIENPEAFLKYDNYPEFLYQEQIFKNATFTAGLTILFGFTCLVSLIIFICYLCNKKSTLVFLYNLDFIPLTGGTLKKSNGGLITIIYSILISSLSIAFILRYFFWNDIIEVSSLDTSKATNRKELMSSIVLELDVFGEYLPCIDENDKNLINNNKNSSFNNSTMIEGSCSPNIIFGKNGNYSYFNKIRNNYFSCISINKRQCRIKFINENCEPDLKNLNTLNFHIKSDKAYVSLYKWVLKNYWDTTLHNANSAKMPGYSFAEGIFKANDDITNMKYVFKGDNMPSIISLSLSSIYYSIESDDSFSGHRISFLNYQRNELKNEYNFNTKDSGVKLDFEFTVSPNSNIVNVKKDISLIDFFAFLLGILAGFGFLSRVTKHVLEKCNCLNYTEADRFVVLKEEIPPNIEMAVQKIDKEN